MDQNDDFGLSQVSCQTIAGVKGEVERGVRCISHAANPDGQPT